MEQNHHRQVQSVLKSQCKPTFRHTLHLIPFEKYFKGDVTFIQREIFGDNYPNPSYLNSPLKRVVRRQHNLVGSMTLLNLQSSNIYIMETFMLDFTFLVLWFFEKKMFLFPPPYFLIISFLNVIHHLDKLESALTKAVLWSIWSTMNL